MKDLAAVFTPWERAECLRRGEEAAAKWERLKCPKVASDWQAAEKGYFNTEAEAEIAAA